MTLFTSPADLAVDPAPEAAPEKRPARWSVRNWPVRWKVVAIALVPLLLATLFGGLRIHAAMSDADDLQLAAERAELVSAITTYMGALDSVLLAYSTDGDKQGAAKNYESRKYQLQSRTAGVEADTDVRSGVTTLLNGGQALLDKVSSNGIGLRDRVTGYAPILLTAENAITGSVRASSEQLRATAEGLSRAVGARGQMMMQQLLVTRGGEIPEPELRTSMITLAGTEPSTLFGMSEVLGVGSERAGQLQQQMVRRMAIMSDPAAVLVDNPDLLSSMRTTSEIAGEVITEATAAVTQAVDDKAADRRSAAVRDSLLVLAAIALALLVTVVVARSLVGPLRLLRDGALRVAHGNLEREIARVRAGDEREPEPLPVYTTEEIGQVAHAVDELHAQALLLAGDEARLRVLVNDMFETMSRRNRSLVDQQLTLIDQLERNEQDPDRLDSLFRLDHLAARMRRNGANLLVLAGARASRDQGGPLALATLVDAAMSEVEDYRRVQTSMMPDATVVREAAADVAHLVAELIDNALRYSPPGTPVEVSAAYAADNGVLIEITDTGLGMTETDLRIANMRLTAGGEVSPESARHMGLFVVGRLAHQHGMRVRLRARAAGSGTIAEVYLPPGLLVGAAAPPLEIPAAAPPAPAAPDLGAEPPAVAASATLLPQRSPGSSGITGAPAPAADREQAPHPWWEKEIAAPVAEQPAAPERANTAAFFAGRARADAEEPAAVAHPELSDMDELAAELAALPPGTAQDVIYQRMLSEFLVDPHELAHSRDLDWQSVWDHGWSVAAEVDNVPVETHTDHGLPVRQPGARLIPGGAETPANAGAYCEPDQRNGVASASGSPRKPRTPGTPQHEAPPRDPDAIRASIASHFGGVRAGRSHARHASQGPDH